MTTLCRRSLPEVPPARVVFVSDTRLRALLAPVSDLRGLGCQQRPEGLSELGSADLILGDEQLLEEGLVEPSPELVVGQQVGLTADPGQLDGCCPGRFQLLEAG